MTVYVLEVGGEAVAAVFSASRTRAAHLMLGADFRALMRAARRPSGAPLWDGAARLFVRDADEREERRALAARASVPQGDTQAHVLMLVDVEVVPPAGEAADRSAHDAET